MKKLALCIPTFQRSGRVEELLGAVSGFTGEGFIIHIFDSSRDDRTKRVVEGYAERNVLYEFVEGVECSNEKVFRIYEYMAGSDADYVWIMNDHSVFTDAALKGIQRALEEDGDFYLLDVRCPGCFVKDFHGLNDFLMRGAWQLTYYGAAIVKRRTFLRNVDWQALSQKYLTPETMEYSQLGFYFERASQLAGAKVKEIGLVRDAMMDRMRDEKPAWQKDKFRICTQCWHEVITRLPEVYTQKAEALRTMDSWYLSKYSLMELKEDDAYNIRSFLKYGRFLEKIAPDVTRTAFWIAILPLGLCRRLLTGALLARIRKARKEGRRIFIYGAGRHGVDCTNYLESCSIRHDGFLVTDTAGNPECVRDYPVYAARDKLRDGVLIILAFLAEGKSPVEEELDKLKAGGMDIDYMAFNA